LFRRVVLATAFLLIPGSANAASQADAAAGKVPAVPGNKVQGTPSIKAQGPSNAPAGKAQGKLASKVQGKLGTKVVGKADKKQAKKLPRNAAIELYEINTKETLKLRFYDDRGKPIKGWQKRFDRFMRCHLTKAVFKMSPRLAQMLYQTSRHFEGRRIEVVSGYRHPKVARNPRSPHKSGVACDFRVVGIANTVLRDYLRNTFSHAGVGFYPNSVFVHLDDRKNGKSAFWIDYSGPGQEASYAENPIEDLKNGKADRKGSHDEDMAGRAEGADDIAQAGAALRTSKSRDKAGQNNAPSKGPLEVKSPSDPFGD
jgi:uncharacterized protein YcbK (DUF882 family)